MHCSDSLTSTTTIATKDTVSPIAEMAITVDILHPAIITSLSTTSISEVLMSVVKDGFLRSSEVVDGTIVVGDSVFMVGSVLTSGTVMSGVVAVGGSVVVGGAVVVGG